MAGASIRSSLPLASTTLVSPTSCSARPRSPSASRKWAARNTRKKRRKKKMITEGRWLALAGALASMHQFRGEDQVHALRFSLRQNFAKRLQRRRMRMSDGYGFSLFARTAQGKLQLLAHRADFGDIVQEWHVAKSGADAQTLRLVVRDGGSGGSAVDVKELVLAQHRHQFVHQPGVRGRLRALMIVHAGHVGNALKPLIHECGHVAR